MEKVRRESLQDTQVQLSIHGETVRAAGRERQRAAEKNIRVGSLKLRLRESDLAGRKLYDEWLFRRQQNIFNLNRQV
jgi:hypothetical protein